MMGHLQARTGTIRSRTWALTISIFVSLVLYFFVSVVFKNWWEIGWVDLIFAGILQVVMHFMYFPDGELFGQTGDVFIRNKQCYNEKALAINEQKKIGQLRDYCEVEAAERRKRYIATACGAIGITDDEFNELSRMTKKEIAQKENFEMNGKVVHLTRERKKSLYKLIFGTLPVEANDADVILSAVENDTSKAIRDGSVSFKNRAYIKKMLIALVVSTFFAYLSYTWKDGLDWAIIPKMAIYITSAITTAVTSFSKGETCQKVYKNKFYVELSNFIDGFFEWSTK